MNYSFFSYSRIDSEFALKLANDLRTSGINIWLDQLDINPGTHWDTSIESALKDADWLIVILSHTSLLSNNVMDEISFALENGKNVIPVKINECKSPLRLIRLQHIDFTKDYEIGKKQLLKILNINKVAEQNIHKDFEKKVEENKKENPTKNELNTDLSKSSTVQKNIISNKPITESKLTNTQKKLTQLFLNLKFRWKSFVLFIFTTLIIFVIYFSLNPKFKVEAPSPILVETVSKDSILKSDSSPKTSLLLKQANLLEIENLNSKIRKTTDSLNNTSRIKQISNLKIKKVEKTAPISIHQNKQSKTKINTNQTATIQIEERADYAEKRIQNIERYNQNIKWVKNMISVDGCEGCKKTIECKNMVVKKLKEAISIDANGKEAIDLLKCIEN